MPKKNHRPTVAVRKKIEEQKLAQKQARRLAFWQQYKKQILIGAAVAVAAIILLAVAIDYFYMPTGSLRTFMGKPTITDETSLVRGMDGHYFELGKMTTPEGYQAADYGMDMTSDPYENYFYYVADDENAAINNVFVSGVENRNGADMVTSLLNSGVYTTYSEAKDAEVGGHKVNYLYTTAPVYDENGNVSEKSYCMLIMYVDTIRHSTMLVSCSSSHLTEDLIPTEEAMLAEAESILSCLQVP